MVNLKNSTVPTATVDALLTREMEVTGLDLETIMRALAHILGKELGDVLSEAEIREALSYVEDISDKIKERMK